MKYDKLIIGGLLFLSFYTTFWLWFLAIPPHKNIVNIPKQQSAFASTQNNNLVLGASASQPSLPSRYSMPIESRRQYFNLSCEFAAASGIIFYFTNNPDFAVGNQAQAEKELIKQVWISRNPNVGIRMGMVSATSLDSLYVNLNKGFGGADYYGIHAPPFIDLFANYKLTRCNGFLMNWKVKDKRIKVKNIGKNAKGDLTINGKPLLRFRIIPKDEQKDK